MEIMLANNASQSQANFHLPKFDFISPKHMAISLSEDHYLTEIL